MTDPTRKLCAVWLAVVLSLSVGVPLLSVSITGVVSAGNTQSPTATAQVSDVAGTQVLLDGSASSDDGSISSYEWDVDDDGTYESTGKFVKHDYATNGPKTVTLRVTDADNNTDTDQVTFETKTGFFSFAMVNTTAPVTEGENMSATVSVRNLGRANGTQTVYLRAGGTTRNSTSVFLTDGESKNVTLSWGTADGDAGIHDLTFRSGDGGVTQSVTIETNQTDHTTSTQNTTESSQADTDTTNQDTTESSQTDTDTTNQDTTESSQTDTPGENTTENSQTDTETPAQNTVETAVQQTPTSTTEPTPTATETGGTPASSGAGAGFTAGAGIVALLSLALVGRRLPGSPPR